MSKGYWIFGKHPVEAAISNPKRVFHEVMLTKEAHDYLKTKGLAFGKAKVSVVAPNDFAKVAELRGAVHQGYALRVSYLENPDISDLEFQNPSSITIVALDQVTDPHNVGAIIRSAAAFGVKGVIMQKANSPQESGVLAKSAAGLLEVMPIYYVGNLVQAFKDLKKMGFWIFGMDGEARDDVQKLREYPKKIIVMGSEGEGMRRLTKESCDMLIKIPMDEGVESLNVSNAAAIAFYASR